jgi:hypothetical protein
VAVAVLALSVVAGVAAAGGASADDLGGQPSVSTPVQDDVTVPEKQSKDEATLFPNVGPKHEVSPT